MSNSLLVKNTNSWERIRKRLKRSPDKGDALANTFYPRNEERILQQREQAANLHMFATAFH